MVTANRIRLTGLLRKEPRRGLFLFQAADEQAWRHVHDIFAGHGASNVKWVWGPNVFGGSAVDFTPYYPGSDVVDVLALDGYNWGSLDVWQTYTQVFGSSYDKLCQLDNSL